MKKLTAAVSILLGITIFLGVYYNNLEKDSKEIKEIDLKVEKFEMIEEKNINYFIYLPDEKFTKLEKSEEILQFSSNKNELVKTILEKVLNRLKEKKLVSEDILLKNIFFKNNEIYINLSTWKEKDEKKSLYILYSITNSLSENIGECKVKFLINNEEEKGIFSQYYEKNLNI